MKCSTERTINKILIVGGGTAGWISAGILAKQLGSKSEEAVQVTLVESPNIPILGVGEGTWPTMRATLQTLGVDEGEFMRECSATFKQGSEFVNWANTPQQGEKNGYYHPLSAVFHSAYDFNLAPYWALNRDKVAAYDLATASQAHICNMGLAPKKITTPAYSAIQNYSYHLDANKFAAFLHEHCVKNLGVEYISANVTEVELDDSGYIDSVGTDSAGQLNADFFIDCSGARGLLIGDKLGIKWKPMKDVIFNDTAMAMQVPYPSEDTPIATHTIATAHESGWTWDIGLHERRGVGFVYSEDYTTDQRAEEILRGYVKDTTGEGGSGIDDDLDCRKLKFNTGYREKFWHKNCLAMGMSAAFIEPLEASAIFLVEAGINMVAEQFPHNREDMAYVEKQYNHIYTMRWDKTIDFVKLHYCISKRRDHDYWIDNCRPETVPDSLKEKLEHWKSHPPSKYDFDDAFEPFVLDSYLFVLYGMEYDFDLSGRESRYTQMSEANRKFREIEETVKALSRELPAQRELIEKVYKYGFSTI